MQQFAPHRFRRPFAALALAAALAVAGQNTAQAVELGDAQLRSHIGQPLIADIELTMLSDPGSPVQVRLSHPDVYRGANIRMHPLLSTLNMSVMRRDGRQFLHVTSVKPLESDYLHLFLDLSQAGKTNVRAVTLWLTPDPTPAPPAAAVSPALIAAAIVAARPVPPAPVPATTPVIAAPANCPRPKYSAEQIKVCATLDYKNGLLSAQIVELEEKVKLLQQAIETKAEAAHAAPAPALIAPVAKGPVPIKPEAPPKKDKAADAEHEDKGGLPWLLIGIGVALLALIGGGVFFFLRRRKKGPKADAPADDAAPAVVAPEDRADYMAKLKESLQRKKKEAAGS